MKTPKTKNSKSLDFELLDSGDGFYEFFAGKPSKSTWDHVIYLSSKDLLNLKVCLENPSVKS